MAISHEQSTATVSASPASSVSVSFSSTPSVGNLATVGVCSYDNDTISGVTDNQTPANTYTEQIKNHSGTYGIHIFSSIIATASGTFTVTANGVSGDYYTIGISEFSGVAASPTVETNSASGVTSTPVTGEVTPSGNNLYYASLTWSYANHSVTEDGDWTLAQEEEDGQSNQGISNIYKITSGTDEGAWTMAGDGGGSRRAIATFDEASAAGRTTRNTDAFSLGINYGQSFRM